MQPTRIVICSNNEAFPVSLEKRKIYECVVDADALKHGQLRIIDESGDDYLYPAECFVDAQLSDDVRQAIIGAA